MSGNIPLNLPLYKGLKYTPAIADRFFRFTRGFIPGVFVLACLLFSCKKEKFYEGNTNLRFSADTVSFDTVFTLEPGTNNPISVTQIISIFNKESGTVKANIRLAGGKNSAFRFSVDGFQGPVVNDLEIPAKDSVFLFIQCSLVPNNQTMPMIVMDSLLTTIGNAAPQKTILTAYGWDATYVRRQSLPCGGTWSNKLKPYVIVDGALVPKGCTFTIKEGVTVYNTPRSTLFVEGTLNIEGTASERVKFTGNKPLHAVKYYPSQWVGIQFLPESVNSKIKFADIHNAAIGIRVDSSSNNSNYKLTLENSTVMHCGTACMVGVTGSIKAVNCAFAEGGTFTFYGLLGGDYEFVHCTFANYLSNGVYPARKDAQFAITNTLRDDYGRITQTRSLNCTVYNSIIWGNNEEEFYRDDAGSQPFVATIKGSYIRSKQKLYSDISLNNTYNVYPKFKKYEQYNYQLDTLSPCKNAGIAIPQPVSDDLLGIPRNGNPDVGAYERID